MFNTNRNYNLSTGVKSASIAVINTGKRAIVVLHQTMIVDATEKQIVIRNGGWDTVCTRTTINRALSELGTKAYLGRVKGKTYLFDDGRRYEFDGLFTIKLR